MKVEVGDRYSSIPKRSFKNALIRLLEDQFKILGSHKVLELIADEILAYHSEIGEVQSGMVGYGSMEPSGGLTVGMNAPTPGEFETPEHQLVNMGGLFQRV